MSVWRFWELNFEGNECGTGWATCIYSLAVWEPICRWVGVLDEWMALLFDGVGGNVND
jgi:hypothetical protein